MECLFCTTVPEETIRRVVTRNIFTLEIIPIMPLMLLKRDSSFPFVETTTLTPNSRAIKSVKSGGVTPREITDSLQWLGSLGFPNIRFL